MKKAMDEKKTKYCTPQGIEPLREAIASYVGKERGVSYNSSNVLVQPGGKPVIAKFFVSLMEEGDEVLIPAPAYPIYESIVNFYGGVVKPYLYHETDTGYVINFDEIKSMITPKTKFFVYNNLHNPTGAVSSKKEMQDIADLCAKHNLWVLSDEAYFHLVYGVDHGESIVSYSGMLDRTVILLTCSKSWAMTGVRLGAAIGPKTVIDAMTLLTTNDEGMVCQFVQFGAIPAFLGKCDDSIVKMRHALQERRDLLVKKVREIPGFHCHTPDSTFYLIVNVSKAMKDLGLGVEEFRQQVLKETGVSFCTRNHFGTPIPSEKELYIRFAYSGIDLAQIEEGCNILKKFVEDALAKKK